jgi:hypothetical protein
MPYVMYHWTHRLNLESILRKGIDPSYSEGKLQVVWSCGPQRIGWALAHVAQRHGWDCDDMACLEFESDGSDLIKTCLHRVYQTRVIVLPVRFRRVKLSVGENWIPVEMATACIPSNDK